MNEKKLIGERIQEIRKNRKLSQEQVAERADISPNYLSRIECGKENPTLDMLIKLTRALGTEMWELFDFGHEGNIGQLKEAMTKVLKEADEEKFRLLVKIARAVVR